MIQFKYLNNTNCRFRFIDVLILYVRYFYENQNCSVALPYWLYDVRIKTARVSYGYYPY